MENVDYRVTLKSELELRLKRNSKYSLRAMARDLALSPGFLNQILNSKRNLSEDKAQQIAKTLNWDSFKTRIFVNNVRYSLANDLEHKESIISEIKHLIGPTSRFNQVQEDTFKLMANWYYFAISSLSETKNFISKPKAIAKRLGLKEKKVSEAIALLKRLNIMVEDNGTLAPNKENYTIEDFPSKAIRQYHGQYLDKAKELIEKGSIYEKDFSGITLAVNKDKLPEAKELIRRFRREMMELVEVGDQDSVYHLAIQFFRLDQLESKDN